MLVLSRFIDQSIVIDGNIEVTVRQIGKGRVQLAFNAPPTVRIVRRELMDELMDDPQPQPSPDSQTTH